MSGYDVVGPGSKAARQAAQQDLRSSQARLAACSRCGAQINAPCTERPGIKMAAGGYHLARWVRWKQGW